MITISNDKIAAEVASELLKVGAVKINAQQPFTWASGWKSPIYCDNRMTLSYPDTRSVIKYYLGQVINEHFKDFDAIAGVATAGIPQGALLAEQFGLPFLYVRSKPKGHGMENLIEGNLQQGQKVLLIEDLISTGGSSLKAAQAIKEAGGEVVGMAAIFTYGFDLSKQNFEKDGIKLVCLSSYDSLLQKALQEGVIKEDQLESLKQWRENPADWGK